VIKTQEMEKTEQPTFTDVKNAYLFKLVEMHDAIAWCLARGDTTSARSLITVLLARIDISDATDYIKQAKEDFINNKNTYQYPNTKILYNNISEFLNKTYFAECKGPKPEIKHKKEAHF
jgi:hypothetical protein